MTAIANNAWWCEYCTHNENNMCDVDVPYYCSSLDCIYFAEFTEEPRPKHRRFDLNKILVETV